MFTFLHLRISLCLYRAMFHIPCMKDQEMAYQVTRVNLILPIQCDVFNNGVSFRRQLMHKRLEFFIFVFYRCILIDNFDKLRLQSALCVFERFELTYFGRLGLVLGLTFEKKKNKSE